MSYMSVTSPTMQVMITHKYVEYQTSLQYLGQSETLSETQAVQQQKKMDRGNTWMPRADEDIVSDGVRRNTCAMQCERAETARDRDPTTLQPPPGMACGDSDVTREEITQERNKYFLQKVITQRSIDQTVPDILAPKVVEEITREVQTISQEDITERNVDQIVSSRMSKFPRRVSWRVPSR